MAKEIPDVAPRSIGDQKVVPVRVNGKPMMMALSEFAALTGRAVGSERNDSVQLSTWQDVTHAAKVADAEATGAGKAVALGAASGITWGLGPMATLAAAEAMGDKGLKKEIAEEMAVLREAHGGKALLAELAAAMGPQALEMIGARLGRGAAGAASGAAASAPVAPAAGGPAGLLSAAPARASAAQGTARAGEASTLGGMRAASAQPLEGELLSTRGAANALPGPIADGEIVPSARAFSGAPEAPQLPAARGLARGVEEGTFEAGPRALQEPPLEGGVVPRTPELGAGGRPSELPFAATRPAASPFEATLPALERGAAEEGGILSQMRGVEPAAYERVGVSAGGKGAEGALADNLGARAAEDIATESPDLGFFSYPKEARAAIRGGKVKPNAAELRADLANFEKEMAGTPGFENQRRVLLHDLQKQSELEAEYLNARGAERAADVGAAADLKTGAGGQGLLEANPQLGGQLRAAALGPEGLIPSVEGRALNEAAGALRGGKVGGSTIGEMRDAALRSSLRGPEAQAADRAAVRAGVAEREALALTPEEIARNAQRVEGPAFQKEAKDVPGAYLNKPLSDDPEMQARIQEILAQIEGKEARGKALVPQGPGGMAPPSGDFASPNSLPPGPPGLPPAAGAGGSGGGLLPPGGAGPGGAALSPAGQNVLAAMQLATQQGATPLQAAQAVAKAQQQTIVQGMAQASGVLPSALRADLGQAFIQGAASQIENDLVADRPVAVGAAVANGLAGVALAGAASRAFSRVGGLGHSPTTGGPNVQSAGGLGGTQEKLQKFIRNAAFQQLRPSAQTIKAARRLGVIDDIGEQLLNDVPRAMGKKSLSAMTPDEMLEGVTKLIERNGDAMGDILAVGNQAVRSGKARIEPAVKLYNSLEMMAQQAEQMVGFGDKVAENIRIGRDHWAKAMGLRNSMGQFAANAATKPTDLRKLKDLSNWAKSLVYLGETVPELRLDPVKKAFAGVRDLIETELSTMSDDVFAQIGKPGLAEKYAYIKQQYQASRFIAEMAEREAIANAKSNGTINKMANVIQGVVFGTAVMGGAGLETLFAGSARTVGQLFRENANRWAIAAAEKLAGGVAVSAERRVLQHALEKGFQDFIDVDLSQAQKLAIKLPTSAQTAQMAVNIQNLANNPTALNNAAMQTAQNMGAVSPQMAQQVQDSFKAGVKTLAGFIPTAYQRMKYSDATPQFDPYELKKFALALRAVTDPGSIAQDLARGQLSPTSWDALQKWDPELAINMQDQLRASIAMARATKGKKFHWTPQKETAMATILKDADLPSLKPKTIKLNQATYMQLAGDGSGGAPAAGGGKGPMAGGQGAAARIGGASFAKSYATGPQKTAFGGF